MTREQIELIGGVEISNDVQQRVKRVGVRGMDIDKAKELGFFNRISFLLCASHACVMAAYRIYGGVDYLLSEFGAKKNEIKKAMNDFEKAFDRFVNFWTDYYTKGDTVQDVNEETETLYRRVMEWAQLPIAWSLGEPQRIENDDCDVAIKVNTGSKQYTFKKSVVNAEILNEEKETWCVTKYDIKEHKQITIEENMDKASAMMVAKRLSDTDKQNIYTASAVREYVEKRLEVIPYKAYMKNETVGNIKKQI